MRLSDASQNDYSEILEVWEASVRATHDFVSEADIAFYKPLILNEYLDAVALKCAIDDSGNIVGFIGVAEGNVEMLFIAPQNRGTGVGKSLLMHGIDVMKASKVDVNEQNPDAVGFYKHMGFKQVGRSETDGMGKPYPILHMELA
ncbi:acetyltransferase [Pseudodesulfovibrio sp. zrk46]|uniref:acetyltransferase n=1 Tax=Pseudodesulfovibrio sp. zrk46 TaxID=2725288 RepID=UPI00144904FB|nr:acetyltransferase [Pseudodesulfovibrio sp. zrk46]QJB55388.1 acetyltransferase [Pseudodesulfovibrio sp. zrk46]